MNDGSSTREGKEERPAPLANGESPDRAGDRAGREPGELIVALSPRQIVGGFALLAGLIIWLRRRGRGKG